VTPPQPLLGWGDRPRQSLAQVRTTGVPVSLELRALHRLVADASAASQGLVRVVEESAEDYPCPDRFVVPIEVPKVAARACSRRLASPIAG